MKKIFRMALVFALAGATLLYTGCTKDYDEEINKISGDLSSFQSEMSAKVATLESEISSLKSSVSSLESAYKAADAALQKSIDANAADIKALKSTVDEIKGSIAALENKVKANEDAIAKINALLDTYATKEELAAAKTDLEGQIAAAKEALEKEIAEATAEVIVKLAEAKTEILAKTEALEKDINTLKASLTADEAKIQANADAIAELQKADKEIKDIYAALSNELRALVFIPDLYYAGIEATEYTYTILMPRVFSNTGEWYEASKDDLKKAGLAETWKVWDDDAEAFSPVKVTIPWAQNFTAMYPVQIVAGKDEKGKDVKDNMYYSIGQIGVANYNLNPSSFNPDNAKKWNLYGFDKPYIVKSEAEDELVAPMWEPTVVGTAAKEGNLAVSYTIANPERLNGLGETYYASVLEYLSAEAIGGEYLNVATGYIPPMFSLFWPSYESPDLSIVVDALASAQGVVSVMNLEAVLENKTVESDYEAIVAAPEFFAHLALSSKNVYTTAMGCDLLAKTKDLYSTLDGAIIQAYSIPVTYNAGPVDLAKEITIHMAGGLDASELYEVTLDELNKAYGDRFHYEFALAEYTLGDNETPESFYGDITKEGIFTPCYADYDAEGKPVKVQCPKGDEKVGISAVGRYPVVQVTLYDGEYVVLSAFFKTKIVKEAPKAVTTEIVIPSLGEAAFICTYVDMATSWHQFSTLVLEALGSDYKEFGEQYSPELEGDNSNHLMIYVKNEKGEFVKLAGQKINKKEVGNDYYGYVVYYKDYSTAGVNNAFEWSVNPQTIGAGKDQTIYVHFTRGKYEHVYIAFNASVATKAGVSFGVKNPAYWFNDVTDDVDINTVRANVLVPNKTTDNVLYFAKALDDYFVGNKVTLAFDEETAAAYKKDYLADVKYSYHFASEQPMINGEQLIVKDDKIYLVAKDAKGNFKKTDDGKYVIDEAALIAGFIYTDGKKDTLQYYCTEASKKLLNLWGKEETDPAKMIYCNVTIKSEGANVLCYGTGNMGFHVRFIRPVYATENPEGKLVDAVPGGSECNLGDLLSAQDWQNFKIFEHVPATYQADKVTIKTPDYFKPGLYTTVAGNVINWFQYYGFDKIGIDFNKVQTNQTGEWKYLKDVNPAAKLALYKDNAEVPATDGVAEASLTPSTNESIPALKTYKLHYENNMGVVKDFQLRVPVYITYFWGKLEYVAVINVSETYTKK